MPHNTHNHKPHTPALSAQEDLKHSLPKGTSHSRSALRYLFCYFPPTTFILLMTILVFCVGFIVFSEKTERLQPPNPLPKADAIIVLTGGENRIETGLDLLQKGLGSRLLISGVNTTTNLKQFMHNMHISPQLFSCCIDIGQKAINTKGNAEESAAWIKKYNYKTLYIVTHDYHMWRSMRELKYLMPDIHFIAYPVKKRKFESTIQQLNQIRILIFQYLKTIEVYIRTTF
ncbi:YdcF family protein [Bartonella raoultii]|uniref:YdcF family protein n=1 Tax=Bartonella raoultii TaxID=1457020 RepID=A0ABS7I4X2_9HYPH|nr:YdcF family protein [Bartonella raoultii]MBX4335881.1 YdcF family protein [Bartonella raoultii]